MPRKKEILEDQETEVLALAVPEEAAEIPDFPADPPEAHEEMSPAPRQRPAVNRKMTRLARMLSNRRMSQLGSSPH